MAGRPRPVRIAGARGNWTAMVEGDRLAVLHTTWRKGTDGYEDPMIGAKTDGAKYTRFVEALRAHDRVVLQRDARDGSLARDGYVGLFRTTDLTIRDDGSISLCLAERLPLTPA